MEEEKERKGKGERPKMAAGRAKESCRKLVP